METADVMIRLRQLVRAVPIAREVQERAVQLVMASHPEHGAAVPLAKKYVRYGASPRGAQALILAGKIYALLDNRYHVAKVDIERAAPGALRHRIILNCEAEGATTDQIVAALLARN